MKEQELLGKAINLFKHLAKGDVPLEVDEITSVLDTFNENSIEVFYALANEIADRDMNIERVLILTDYSNCILLAEILHSVLNIDWIDIVDQSPINEKIRQIYTKANDVPKIYGTINCDPYECSEDLSQYNLVINLGNIFTEVVYGPTFAYICEGSKKLIKQQSDMAHIEHYNKHGDNSLVIGYNYV